MSRVTLKGGLTPQSPGALAAFLIRSSVAVERKNFKHEQTLLRSILVLAVWITVLSRTVNGVGPARARLVRPDKKPLTPTF